MNYSYVMLYIEQFIYHIVVLDLDLEYKLNYSFTITRGCTKQQVEPLNFLPNRFHPSFN